MRFKILCLTAALIFGAANAVAETGPNVGESSDGYSETLHARAAAGNEKAQMKLATMYLRGDGVAANIDKALYYYRLVAQQDVAYAQYRLAKLYLDGEYLEPDSAQALSWLRRAARLGFVQAQLELSSLYQTGATDVPRDLIQSHKWLSIASSLTDTDLTSARESLESEMSFTEVVQAKIQSSLCIFTGYQEC